MPTTIAINGVRLDKVLVPTEPQSSGCPVFLNYPKSAVRCVKDDGCITVSFPAYLCAELYRTGVLPQDASIPVQISIGGRSVGRYTVSHVFYPGRPPHPHGGVTFTLIRVSQRKTRDASTPRRPRSAAKESGTYITDITHYLDDTGELAEMPGPARQLASFLSLLIEAATSATVGGVFDSRIRCRAEGCTGTILTFLPPTRDEIIWRCAACEHNGVIRNWHDTKWNILKGAEETR